jgi:hypothetical protein
MTNRFFERLLVLVTWLVYKTYGDELFDEDALVIAFKVRLSGGIKSITGENLEMKIEIGQYVDVEAKPIDRLGRGAQIEAGSAQWSIAATDAQGNDVSDQFTVTPNASNELACRFQHAQDGVECTALATLRADGDPDIDEAAPVVGTLDIVVDQANVVAFDLQGTAGDAPASTGTSDTVSATPATSAPVDAASTQAVNDVSAGDVTSPSDAGASDQPSGGTSPSDGSSDVNS